MFQDCCHCHTTMAPLIAIKYESGNGVHLVHAIMAMAHDFLDFSPSAGEEGPSLVVLNQTFQDLRMHAQMIYLPSAVWVTENSRVEAPHEGFARVQGFGMPLGQAAINMAEHHSHDVVHLKLLAVGPSLCQCATTRWMETLTLEPSMGHFHAHSDDAHRSQRRGSATNRRRCRLGHLRNLIQRPRPLLRCLLRRRRRRAVAPDDFIGPTKLLCCLVSADLSSGEPIRECCPIRIVQLSPCLLTAHRAWIKVADFLRPALRSCSRSPFQTAIRLDVLYREANFLVS